MGYVYLLLQVDDQGLETYKIGVSKNNPELRVKQLSTGNPNQISVLRVYESDNYKKVENWMHRKYHASKTSAENEWRNLTNEEVISFLNDCKKADETISFLKSSNPFCN
jgi:hypothetical protein